MKEEGRDEQGFGTSLRAILPGSLLPAPANLAFGSCLLAAAIQKAKKHVSLEEAVGLSVTTTHF